MKIKNSLLLLFVLAVINLLNNSCKKDAQTSIQGLFTKGTWQLASVMRFHYLGSSQLATDTLNTTCDTTQLFTFNKDNTCSYTNFDCVTQSTAKGNWSVSSDQLFLMASMTCQDTVAGGGPGTSKPFAYAQIINLGNYSMILQTGDIATYYTATTKRTITQYGFIRQQTTGN
jgi:hypothetical protein